MPRLQSFASTVAALERVNGAVGHAVAWLALVLVLVQFAVVVLRYVFSIGFVPMQESVWYLHGLLFMLGAGYTLLNDGHVRIDIFYRTASPRRKAWIDLLGVLIFLTPVCVATWIFSWSYVINAWRVLEGSMEAAGLPAVFLLKTVIWVFVVLLFLQGVAMALRSILTLCQAEAPADGSKSI